MKLYRKAKQRYFVCHSNFKINKGAKLIYERQGLVEEISLTAKGNKRYATMSFGNFKILIRNSK